MNLDDIPAGETVFIDSNIFIYHFTGASGQCSDLLSRCEQKELTGITLTNVLLEVLHRLMMVEAVSKKLVEPPNIVKKLNRKPALVRQLGDYYFNTLKIFEMGIEVRPIRYDTFLKSEFYRSKYGFLVNDSIIAAALQTEKAACLATRDDAFLPVLELAVYQPDDLAVGTL